LSTDVIGTVDAGTYAVIGEPLRQHGSRCAPERRIVDGTRLDW
jgi:hypothetical protein